MNDGQDQEYAGIRDRMRNFNEPPATPADEMWPAVQASWQQQVRDRKVVVLRRRRIGTGLAAAALVVLGVAIGRWSTGPGSGTPVVVATAPANGETVPLTYRLAASRHFSQSETMLLLFRSEPAEEDVAPLARNLLITTRLLLDSRAADDLRVRELLLDLELVFSQMVQLAPGNDVGERELITESLDDNGLLPRLRTLIPTDPVQRAGV